MPKGMRGRTETLPPNTVLCPIGFTYVHVLRLLCVSGVPSSLASISMLPPPFKNLRSKSMGRRVARGKKRAYSKSIWGPKVAI